MFMYILFQTCGCCVAWFYYQYVTTRNSLIGHLFVARSTARSNPDPIVTYRNNTVVLNIESDNSSSEGDEDFLPQSKVLPVEEWLAMTDRVPKSTQKCSTPSVHVSLETKHPKNESFQT